MRRKLNHSWNGALWIATDRNETVHALIIGCSSGMARNIAKAFFPDLMYELRIVPERIATDGQRRAALCVPHLTRDDLTQVVRNEIAAPAVAKPRLPKPAVPKPRTPPATSGRVKLWTGPIGKLSAGGAQ